MDHTVSSLSDGVNIHCVASLACFVVFVHFTKNETHSPRKYPSPSTRKKGCIVVDELDRKAKKSVLLRLGQCERSSDPKALQRSESNHVVSRKAGDGNVIYLVFKLWTFW